MSQQKTPSFMQSSILYTVHKQYQASLKFSLPQNSDNRKGDIQLLLQITTGKYIYIYIYQHTCPLGHTIALQFQYFVYFLNKVIKLTSHFHLLSVVLFALGPHHMPM